MQQAAGARLAWAAVLESFGARAVGDAVSLLSSCDRTEFVSVRCILVLQLVRPTVSKLPDMQSAEAGQSCFLQGHRICAWTSTGSALQVYLPAQKAPT
jgi:hypothetical protein